MTAPSGRAAGCIYAARFRIVAAEEVRKATLVLEQGWADGYTVNGQAPQPLTQGSSDGRLRCGFGHIPAGHTLVFWLSLQVEPDDLRPPRAERPPLRRRKAARHRSPQRFHLPLGRTVDIVLRAQSPTSSSSSCSGSSVAGSSRPLAPSDLVLLVVIGDLVQNSVTQSDQSVTGVFLADSTFALLTVAFSVVTYKSRRARTMVEGTPLILVQDGEPVKKNLRSERLNIEDVAEEARGQGIERLNEVKWCVLEADGSMSFIQAA